MPMRSFLSKYNHPLARQIIAALLGGGIVRLFGMVLAFVVGVQLARALGPAGYGVYSTVMAILALLIVPAKLGLSSLVVREISTRNRPGQFAEAKGVLLGFPLAILTMSLMLTGVAWAFFYFIPQAFPQITSAFLYGLAILPLYALIDFVAYSLMGFQRMVLAQSIDALIRPGLFALFLLGAHFLIPHLDPAISLLLHALAALVAVVLGLAALAATTPAAIRIASPAVFHWRMWAMSALPMVGTEIVRAIDANFGVLLIGYILAIDQAGIFRMAFATAGLLAIPPLIINLTVPPFAARLRADDDTRRLGILASNAAAASFACTAGITLGLVLFGDRLIVLAFGAAFEPALPALIILSAGSTLAALAGATASILNVTGHEQTVTFAYTLGMVVNIVLSIVLGTVLGTVGVALAISVAQVLKAFIVWQKGVRGLGVDTSAMTFFRRAFTGSA